MNHDIGYAIDPRTTCVIVTDITSGQRLVAQRRFFILTAGAHPRAIAGRLTVSSSVMERLGFIVSVEERAVISV